MCTILKPKINHCFWGCYFWRCQKDFRMQLKQHLKPKYNWLKDKQIKNKLIRIYEENNIEMK